MGPPQEASRERGRLRSRCTRWWPRLRALAPWVGALAVLLGLVLAVRPQRFAAAAERFDPVYAPVVAALCLAYYVLQGDRCCERSALDCRSATPCCSTWQASRLGSAPAAR